MTSVPLGVIAIITALVAASWAALLALAEESPKVARALADTTTEREEPTTRYRVIHLSRLALLLIAGVSGAHAVEWWQRTSLSGLGVIIISVGFLYMIAEALPRAVGLLAPDLAVAAANDDDGGLDVGAVWILFLDGAFCSDGILNGGEQCDDGNLENGDGCDHICQTEV